MSSKYNLSPSEKLNYVQKGHSKSHRKQAWQQGIISFVLISVLILILIPYYNNNKKRKDMENEIALLKESISYYEGSNDEIADLLVYLNSNQAIEEKARLNFGLQKQGEKVIVIQKQENEADITTKEVVSEEELSNPQKWLNYFFN